MKKLGNNIIPHTILIFFAFLLYGNTLKYDYTLDDLIVVKENAFTVKGLSGIKEIFSYDSFTGFFGKEKKLVVGGRYRPFSIATFAVEYAVVGGFSPFLSHFINILLYAITGILIFLILRRIVRSGNSPPWVLAMPFVTAVLFLAHPVHTEVVANIKGRDELLALLFPLLSLWLILKYAEAKGTIVIFLASLSFFLGLLSKENAIVFILIIPLALYFFTAIPIKRVISIGLALLFPAILFVFIRFLVLGYFSGGKLPDELLNNPFLFATASQKFGTILYTLGLYIKLLFFPLILTHDYYPNQIPLIPLSDYRAMISLLVYVAIILIALINLPRKNWIAFSLIFYLIPLFIVSNLLFPVGTFMNERFIYMSSLGFLMLISWLITVRLPLFMKNDQRILKITSISILTIVLLLSVRTVLRNHVWKDNFTLFTSDVLVSGNSIKCNVAAGGEWMKKADEETDSVKKDIMYQSAFTYLEKAIQLYPKATNGYILYGNAFATYRKDPKKAIEQYLKVLAYDPYEANAYGNTVKVLNSIDNAKETDYKIAVYNKLLKIQSDNSDVNYNLGKLYGQYKNNLDSSVFFLERSLSLAPGNVSAYKDLGIVYSLQGNFEKALSTLNMAQKLAPDDQFIRQNILTTTKIMKGREKKNL